MAAIYENFLKKRTISLKNSRVLKKILSSNANLFFIRIYRAILTMKINQLFGMYLICMLIWNQKILFPPTLPNPCPCPCPSNLHSTAKWKRALLHKQTHIHQLIIETVFQILKCCNNTISLWIMNRDAPTKNYYNEMKTILLVVSKTRSLNIWNLGQFAIMIWHFLKEFFCQIGLGT